MGRIAPLPGSPSQHLRRDPRCSLFIAFYSQWTNIPLFVNYISLLFAFVFLRCFLSLRSALIASHWIAWISSPLAASSFARHTGPPVQTPGFSGAPLAWAVPLNLHEPCCFQPPWMHTGDSSWLQCPLPASPGWLLQTIPATLLPESLSCLTRPGIRSVCFP